MGSLTVILYLVVVFGLIKLGVYWISRKKKKPPVQARLDDQPPRETRAVVSENVDFPSSIGTEELKYQYEFSFVPSGNVPAHPGSVELEAEEQLIVLLQNKKRIGCIPDAHKAKMLQDFQARENTVLARLDASGEIVHIAFYRDYQNEKKVQTPFEIPSAPVTWKKRSDDFREELAELPRVPVEASAPSPTTNLSGQPFNPARIRPVTGRSSWERLGSYYSIDVETTGLDPEENEIVQIAAVRFLAFSPVDCFVTYVKPKRGINAAAAKINGITSETVADAPDVEALADPLRAYLGEKIPLVGHNIEFDMQFLCRSGLLSPVPSRAYFDTLSAAKSTYNLSAYRLDYLGKTVLHIDRENAHDALSDALAAGYLFKDVVIRKNETVKQSK